MEKLAKKVLKEFKTRFSSEPFIVISPGRVNLLGEHTDYNNGFVLPAAINRFIVLAVAPNQLGRIRLYSVDMQEKYYETGITDSFKKSKWRWPDYLLGAFHLLNTDDTKISGFDCVFSGSIPVGAGLSSSAALETGLIYGLNELWKLGLTKMEMVRLGQRVEHEFVGVNCGIMDQFANMFGMKRNLVKLDCRSLEFEMIPFENRDICIMLCDSNVHRELAGSEYNIRRSQCEEAVSYFKSLIPGVSSLRDISHKLLETYKEGLRPVIYNRSRFIVDENRRVTEGCKDLENDDIHSFGKRMYESHYGLRDLYEVSCRELDFLVGAAENMEAVLGSRMMGGGFGGCTVNLVKEESADQVGNRLTTLYKSKMGIDLDIHIVKTANGTGKLILKDGVLPE